jgi:hypothetical protein
MSKRSTPSPFVLEGKFSCSTFPEPLLNKFGWESCDNCSIQRRLQPNGSRKADNRSCMRSHGGGRKGLIRIKVCCGDTEEINQEAMVDCVSINQSYIDKENSQVEIPHQRVTPSSAGSNRKSISEKWWSDLRTKNRCLQDEISRLKKEKQQLQLEKSRLETENGLLLERIQEFNHLKSELFSYKAKLMKATETISSYKSLPPIHKETNKDSIMTMISTVLVYIMSIIMCKTQQVNRLRMLSQVIYHRELFGSVATARVLREETKRYCRKFLFLPWKVLQSLDLAINGGINYNGLESLRKLEGLRSYEQGCLPSRMSVQRCASSLHDLGQEIIPFHKVECELGEMFVFNYERLVRFILKTFLLDSIAENESVELCITLDGAELTKDLCHLTFGIKITDPRAVDPRDGTPLSYTEDGLLGNLLKSMLGKDSKKAYSAFKDVFEFFDNIMKEGLPANAYGRRIKPLIIWSPQDLSSIWKCLNTGSGARKHGDKHWCHLCPCTGNKIVYYHVEENRFVFCFFYACY